MTISELELNDRIGFTAGGRVTSDTAEFYCGQRVLSPEEEIEQLTNLVRDFSKTDMDVSDFFKQALSQYYSFGPKPTARIGHLIYRLSDLVPREERKAIPINPDIHGTLIVGEIDDPYSELYDSLEDWRVGWEFLTEGKIPIFISHLPEIAELFQGRRLLSSGTEI